MEGFLNPIEVLKVLELKKEMIAADFGSGSGGWVIPLAKKLEEGKVYAIDILAEPLSVLQSKAQAEKLLNIQVIRSNVEAEKGSTLPDSSLDLVLMTNLLFQLEDKKAVFQEAKRVLKEGGEILVVDWKADVPLGPEKGRVSEKQAKEIAKQLGFKLKKEFEAGAHHWGLILEKP